MHFHVLCSNSSDYQVRRDMPYPPHLSNAHLGKTYRDVHIRTHSARTDSLIAAGPSIDGRYSHMFYHVRHKVELDRFLDEDPYSQIGIWCETEISALRFLVSTKARSLLHVDTGQKRQVIAAVGQVKSQQDVDEASLTAARDEGKLIVAGITERQKFFGWINTTDIHVADELLATCGITLMKDETHDIFWVL